MTHDTEPRHAAPRRRAPAALALLAVLALLAAACTVQREPLLDNEQGQVALLSEASPPETPPHPAFDQLTPSQVEASLRRMVVRPSKFISFVRGEPEPFLSESQVTWATEPLARWLPELKPDQRIELRFEDRFKGYDVRAEVYAEGEFIVYRFTELAADPQREDKDTPYRPVNYVAFVPQPGQQVDEDRYAITLRDPILAEVRATAQLRADKLALIDQAEADDLVDEERAERLRALVDERPDIPLGRWETFWDKRRTLQKARDQGLFSPEEFEQRRRSLLDELER